MELKHVGIRARLDLGGYDPTSTRTETRLSQIYCLTTKTTLYVAVGKFKSIYKSVMQIGHAKKGKCRLAHNHSEERSMERAPRLAALPRKVRPSQIRQRKCGRHKSDKGKCGRAQNHTKASADLQLYAGKSGDGDARGRHQPPART